MVIEPIFEADFSENSFGFRPEKSAQGAIKAIKENLKQGKTDIYDADLSSYFDTIPHDKLMKALEERISDHDVLRLIKSWLKAPIHEKGKISGGKSNKTGTPQGGVISPLLANIYLNLLDRNVEKLGSIFEKEGIKIVRYADDFVLMSKEITEEAKAKIKTLIEKLGLTINEDKTQHIKATDKGGFDFLGFNIRYDKSQYNKGQHYWNIHPSKKKEKKFRGKIKDYLTTKLARPIQELVKGLNERIRGHYTYYIIPKVSYLRNEVIRFRNYLEMKLYRYTQRKSQRACKRYGYNVYEHLKDHFGLIDINKIANSKGSL
jgi:group II intron reverse transcriptase/maturase